MDPGTSRRAFRGQGDKEAGAKKAERGPSDENN